MPRPKGNAELKLLEAGRALLEEGGLSAVTVRGVARRSGVNLGLFHYHFRTRDEFAKRLLQECYEDFFSKLEAESYGEGPPLERLRKALLVFGRHVRQNRGPLMWILQDAMRGDQVAIEHAKANIPRHLGVLSCLIEECRAAGVLRKVKLPTLLPFLLGGVNLPSLILTLLERAGAKKPFGMSVMDLEQVWLSDEGLGERVNLLLGALAPIKGKR